MVHRWTRGVDIVALLWILRQMLERPGSIERFFARRATIRRRRTSARRSTAFRRRALALDLRARLRAPRAGACRRLLFLSAAVGGQRRASG